MPTKIEWVARPGTTPETWNPVTGCTKVSEGCCNCYADRMAMRLNGRFGYPKAPNHFDVTLHPDRLEKPLRWRKLRTVFVCSMGDLFHRKVPITFVKEVWNVMAACQEHTFLVLTKRAKLMNQTVNALANLGWTILPNVWLGVTAENQAAADERIPLLLQTPAVVRFVSCEPLLGRVDLTPYLGFVPTMLWPLMTQDEAAQWIDERDWLDGVIVGGESGPGARSMNPDWARGIRDQCQAAGVPFFFKQWGAWLPYDHDPESPMYGIRPDFYTDPDACYSWRKVGKKRAGRLLDGREWNEWPK